MVTKIKMNTCFWVTSLIVPSFCFASGSSPQLTHRIECNGSVRNGSEKSPLPAFIGGHLHQTPLNEFNLLEELEVRIGFYWDSAKCEGTNLRDYHCPGDWAQVHFVEQPDGRFNALIANPVPPGEPREAELRCVIKSMRPDQDFVWDSLKVPATNCQVGRVEEIKLEDLDARSVHEITEKALRYAWREAGTCSNGSSHYRDEIRVRTICEQPQAERVVYGIHYSCN